MRKGIDIYAVIGKLPSIVVCSTEFDSKQRK
jgi:hypothetical protein